MRLDEEYLELLDEKNDLAGRLAEKTDQLRRRSRQEKALRVLLQQSTANTASALTLVDRVMAQADFWEDRARVAS